MRSGLLFICAAVLTAACAGCDDNAANSNATANATATANANTGFGINVNANITREDFEKNKERFEREAKEAGRKIGAGADDAWLWTKTRAALAYAEDLRDVTINVDVENNVVTLTGSVGTDAQKGKAEQIARSVEGVKEVKNQLAVSGKTP
jgi:osmotically-inducible protein OsmY